MPAILRSPTGYDIADPVIAPDLKLQMKLRSAHIT